MRRTHLVAIVLATIALPTIAGTAAQAAVYYPWCAIYGGKRGGDITNCGFVSWPQCMATARGTRGICQPNPEYYAHCRSNCGDAYSETAVRKPISVPPN
jgi:hypothetical protein